MKKIIKKLLSYCGFDISKWKCIIRTWFGLYLVHNVNNADFGKRCLLIYITSPFRVNEISDFHQNQWQAKEMARIIGGYGYIVDVAQYNNPYVKITHHYDMVVGLIPRNIDIYSKKLNPGAIKIAYLTSMNLAVTTRNEQKRLDEVWHRRGVRLKPRRGSKIEIDKKIEEFDAVWYIGNEYNYHSYDCFQMPHVSFIKNSGYSFNWVKDGITRDPKCFLFFGSLGAVHKGLDLLLEIFSEQLSDCTLYVCGGYSEEEDFCKEYYKELFETPNIVTMGFVSIDSFKYITLSEKCAFSILPSCAEGCAGSVLTNMSSGMIPIVSKECGFNDDEVISLPDCKKETLISIIREYSRKDSDWINIHSKMAMNIVRSRYRKQDFSASVDTAMSEVLKRKSGELNNR